MKKTCTIEPENKPYQFNARERRNLRAQYLEFIDYFNFIFPPDKIDSETMVVNFNYVQAMVSMNVCYMEAVRRVLISKGIATKKEINDLMDEAYEEQIKEIRKIKHQ